MVQMTLREAAQQALEALEDPWKCGPDGVADAITTLRAALEKDRLVHELHERMWAYAMGNVSDAQKIHAAALAEAESKCKSKPCEADANGYCARCHSEAYP